MKAKGKPSFKTRVADDFRRNKGLYLMILPILAFYMIFCYGPMYGAVIAFKEFSPMSGILGSPWVGFRHFADFFTTLNAKKIIINTLRISGTSILFGFPAPIIFALALNELRAKKFSSAINAKQYSRT